MPDTKITALTAIGANPIIPSTFPIPMVDLTDTSMAASGTTKKVTVNQILGAGGTATLASATVNGALTVQAATARPTIQATSNGTGSTLRFIGKTNVGVTTDFDIGINLANQNSFELWDNVNSQVAFQYLNTGTHRWYLTGTTAMTLNSTGLGVGVVSPATKLDVRGANNASQATFSGTAGRGLLISTRSDGIADDRTVILNAQFATGSLGQLVIQTAGTDRLLVDNAGNVGVGVTPSAWVSYQKSIDFGGAGNYGSVSARANFAAFATNCYFDGTNWIYKNTNPANLYEQSAGANIWRTATSGTAGNAITFTQAMTLDASGRLILLASTTTPATLSTNGQLTFTATSDTNLRFSYRGSDGVTRVANITLA